MISPQDGDSIRHGCFYVAPPHRYRLLECGHTLTLDPPENHRSPAIDLLFRCGSIVDNAALTHHIAAPYGSGFMQQKAAQESKAGNVEKSAVTLHGLIDRDRSGADEMAGKRLTLEG